MNVNPNSKHPFRKTTLKKLLIDIIMKLYNDEGMIFSVFFTDNSLLEYETHKRGRIYLRRLSGSECSAIASEVLLGTSKLSGSTDTPEESTDTKGRKKNKKDTFYFNGYSN